MRYISYIARYLQSKVNKKRAGLKLYWWKPRLFEGKNFGDEVTVDIIEKYFGMKCVWTNISDSDLIGAGSIIELANKRNREDHTIKVWGSGFLEPGSQLDDPRMSISLVRGPLSRARIDKNDISIGDPGLLASVVYGDALPEKTGRVGIVPHIKDLNSVLVASLVRKGCIIISPLQPPEKVAMDIAGCDLVFSSSLHGLIFSDSFKIPNYRFTLSELEGGDYKFQDYAKSVERNLSALSLEDVVDIVGSPADIQRKIQDYKPISNLEKIQQNIIASFPYKS